MPPSPPFRPALPTAHSTHPSFLPSPRARRRARSLSYGRNAPLDVPVRRHGGTPRRRAFARRGADRPTGPTLGGWLGTRTRDDPPLAARRLGGAARRRGAAVRRGGDGGGGGGGDSLARDARRLVERQTSRTLTRSLARSLARSCHSPRATQRSPRASLLRLEPSRDRFGDDHHRFSSRAFACLVC